MDIYIISELEPFIIIINFNIMELPLFFEVGLMIGTVFILSFITKILRQPTIIAYILSGLVLGSYGLNLIHSKEIILSLSELGIAFLLFIVGMELNVRKLKNLGRHIIFVTLVQMSFIFSISFFLCQTIFNKGFLESFLVSTAMSFSSTMLVIKLLSDRKELFSLYGRYVLGILLVQDIIAVFLLAFISGFSIYTGINLAISFLFGIGLFFFAILCNKIFFPRLLRYISDSPELSFTFALSVCFLFCLISYLLGYSVVIGGFLAGLSLAIYPYNIEIASRITSLRDFFLIFFFVFIGLEIGLPNASILPEIAILFLVATVIKAFSIYIPSSYLGYGSRLSFSSSLSLSQISEFSLIISSFAYAKGIISFNTFSEIGLIAILSFILTPYLIEYKESLYRIVKPFLDIIDKVEHRRRLELLPPEKEFKNHVVVCGAHTMGMHIIDLLTNMKKKFIVVDHNPDTIHKLINRGIFCVFGDIMHEEVLDKLNLDKASFVISTVPNEKANYILIKRCKKENKHLPVFLTAEDIRDAIKLYKLGADYVIVPKVDSISKIEKLVLQSIKRKRGLPKKMRENIIKELEYKYKLLHHF